MGIRGLNSYFKQHGSRNIKRIHVSQLRGSTIAIDTSIYMYKFLEEGCLLEYMFAMVCQCKENDIEPLFVFDGKPDEMKKEVLIKRAIKRHKAGEKYWEMKQEYNEVCEHLSSEEKEAAYAKMMNLKKKSTRVKLNDISRLKELFDTLCIKYYEAPYEADVVCAYLVNSGIAYACVSDDMDMFAYKCSFVLREWNIHNGFLKQYALEDIIKDLNIPLEFFKDVLLLSCNDYDQEKIKIETVVKWFRDYQNVNNGSSITWFEWLIEQKLVSDEKILKTREISCLYDIPKNMIQEEKAITSNFIDINSLRKLLQPSGFIFI